MTDDHREDAQRLATLLAERFGETVSVPAEGELPDVWRQLANRGSCRDFTSDGVDDRLIETLAALALTSPTKSDLQQRDLVVVRDPGIRRRIDELLTSGPLAQAWIPGAPALVIFCGNNRRQRQIHDLHGLPFVNDHLDAFFNAAVDAGIALATFVTAAEAVGLGCCPISAIRNHAAAISDLIGLPDHVFPVAGLGLGWPARPPRVSHRLPLSATVHKDRFDDAKIATAIDGYDRRRTAAQPYRNQRAVEVFGRSNRYGWSEDKARQYAAPERSDWGAFVRAKGFKLD
jgi:nitroreductase/FMN reductase [NAD(P)H]